MERLQGGAVENPESLGRESRLKHTYRYGNQNQAVGKSDSASRKFRISELGNQNQYDKCVEKHKEIDGIPRMKIRISR